MRIAAYINGNSNIFYKDIVVFESMRNKGITIDLYICSDSNLPPSNYKYYLDKYNIFYLPISYDMKEYINRFEGLDVGHYSSSLLVKYYLPIYLGILGYDYVIGLDYDMLCLGSLNVDDILPKSDVMTWLPTFQLYKTINVSQKVELQRKYNIKSESFSSLIPNLGFIVYNTKKYKESDFANKVLPIIVDVQSLKIRHPFDEVAYALCAEMLEIPIKNLPIQYNTRPAWAKIEQDTKLIHFTGFKPWTAINYINSKYINNFPKHADLIQLLESCKIYNDYVSMLPFYNLVFNTNKISPSDYNKEIDKYIHSIISTN